MRTKFRYLFGPVYSWRLGVSVGIDLLSAEQKTCNFNCVYCQLGETPAYHAERAVFVPTAAVLKEIDAFPETVFDYYTFSSSGEPTLALNLGEVVAALKERAPDKKIAVITNASLLGRDDVQKDLQPIDFVLAKVDAATETDLQKINAPQEGLRLKDVLAGIKAFRREFAGALALQIMFIADNQSKARDIARIAQDIRPDEIQINTPLRPCSCKPLSEEDLKRIKQEFSDIPCRCRTVYEAQMQDIKPLNVKDTQKRHGNVEF
jgi:wyosine [tRNA(Phe)-imidazoG37] synthetase (radical SAM superfamily)